MKLTSTQITALKRIKGTENITIGKMASDIGVSRQTLTNLLKSDNDTAQIVRDKTYNSINDYLLKRLDVFR